MHRSISGWWCWFMLPSLSILLLPVRQPQQQLGAAVVSAAFLSTSSYRRSGISVRSSRVPSFQRKLAFSTSFTATTTTAATTTSNETMPTTTTTSNTVASRIRARKVVSPDQLEACGARLRNGELVAFPTETVYGLGCHALDPSAVSKVFAAKERPLTDPLIVHVTNVHDAEELWAAATSSNEDESSSRRMESHVLRALCDTFWPGPLTLVAKAAPLVPPILMANTGFVACRAPSHAVARSLLDHARVPIAAPSANKFGHVSPTRADHVYDDLKYEDVWIVDDAASEVCQVGVESTVAKVDFDFGIANDDRDAPRERHGRITILRQGAVSLDDMRECLTNAGLGGACEVVSSTRSATTEDVSTVSPGQLIRHYSPNIPSYMISDERVKELMMSHTEEDRAAVSSSVVIDFGGRMSAWKDTKSSGGETSASALAYRDLSESGDSAEAAQSVFEALRWAEQVAGATRILFPELLVNDDKTDALTLALKDRLVRAASGVLLEKIGGDVAA